MFMHYLLTCAIVAAAHTAQALAPAMEQKPYVPPQEQVMILGVIQGPDGKPQIITTPVPQGPATYEQPPVGYEGVTNWKKKFAEDQAKAKAMQSGFPVPIYTNDV